MTNPADTVLDHKWLDPACVEGGCQSLVLMAALKEAGEVLRSAHAIATRGGTQTNWSAFTSRVGVALEQVHKIVPPTLTK